MAVNDVTGGASVSVIKHERIGIKISITNDHNAYASLIKYGSTDNTSAFRVACYRMKVLSGDTEYTHIVVSHFESRCVSVTITFTLVAVDR